MEASVGIDIAKATFSVCVLARTFEEIRDFSNDRKGFTKLNSWLRSLKMHSARVCMEATNSYWEGLAEFLNEKRHRVSVVNPYRTAAYWKSEHLRAKTDHIDAAMLARFCNAQNPPIWTPPSREQQKLRKLVREMEFLKAERVRFRVRMEAVQSSSMRRIIADITREIGKLKREILQLIAAEPSLNESFRNLQTVPGIGNVTALIVLSELGDKVHVLDRDQLVAYAGLAPRIFESGTSIRKSRGMSEAGNRRLKRAFYLPALAAVRRSACWHQCFQRLVDRGKPKKLALGAVMRKLFIVACGVLKTGTVYDAKLRAQPA